MSFSYVYKIIFRRRVTSYSIKVSFFSLCGDRENLHNQQNGSLKDDQKFLPEQQLLLQLFSRPNLAAPSPVKKIWINLLPCFNFGNLGSLWIENSCRNAQSRELSWSHLRRKLCDFSAGPLYFLALMIVGVTKITVLFAEIAYVKICASSYNVLKNSCRSINNIVAVPRPLTS